MTCLIGVNYDKAFLVLKQNSVLHFLSKSKVFIYLMVWSKIIISNNR